LVLCPISIARAGVQPLVVKYLVGACDPRNGVAPIVACGVQERSCSGRLKGNGRRSARCASRDGRPNAIGALDTDNVEGHVVPSLGLFGGDRDVV
jgi:hypothetical protein